MMKSQSASLKASVVANYLGQGWNALMGFAFLPVYIHYLGIESFALIGIFGLLQAWLTLLDMGMKPALTREMARFSAGWHSSEFIHDLLRSVVLIGLVIAMMIALGIWSASEWLASDWLTAQRLPIDVVAQAIAWMGLVAASRFIENIYISCLVGLQRQVVQNALGIALATLRGVGVIGVLAWISPSIQAFFLWQALVSLASIAVFSLLVHHYLPNTARPARFSWAAILHIRKFAVGILGISFLALLLTQVDKILLSRLLTLESFGYYALAAMVAAALRLIPAPITTAIYPRFTELASNNNGDPALPHLYHHAAQLVTVLMGSAALMLIVFSGQILSLWTSNDIIAREAAPLLSVLALGTLLNGLMWVPYQLQLAYGWTTLSFRINLVAVLVLVPAILWIVPRFGAIGAAWAWVALNVGYLIFTTHFMHRRLLIREKRRWYVTDVAGPLAAASIVMLLARQLLPDSLGKAGELVALAFAAGSAMLAAVSAAPLVRQGAWRGYLSIIGAGNRSRYHGR